MLSVTNLEVSKEFARLYYDFNSVDKALVEIEKIIPHERYSALLEGLKKVKAC